MKLKLRVLYMEILAQFQVDKTFQYIILFHSSTNLILCVL